MKYRKFGKTGWVVSQLSLGSVELGLKYGLYGPGEARRPSKTEAVELVLYALEQGINLIDTAPTYGASETIIGAALKAWKKDVYIATKVNTSTNSHARNRSVMNSIEASLKRLGRDCLDLVQMHNVTRRELQDGRIMEALLDAHQQGKLQYIGVSVYETDAALEALRHPQIAVLQVAYNLLDQRMAAKVFPQAVASDVAILVRSALLKGVLTERYQQLPAGLLELRHSAEKAYVWSSDLDEPLSHTAIRFCLSSNQVSSVLLGVRTVDELRSGLIAANRPPLNSMQLLSAKALSVSEEPLVDPRTWEIP